MAESEANKKKRAARAPQDAPAGEKDAPESETVFEQAAEQPADLPEDDVWEESDAQPMDEMERLREENQSLADRNLRLMAEFDNYRKRTQRERDSIYPEAVANTLKEIIPIVDNFKRAMEASCTDEGYAKGVQLIYQSLWEKLTALGVEELAQPGEAFDPNFHEAVMHIDDEGLGKNMVSQVLQQGYKIGDRVIRHAMVQVAN